MAERGAKVTISNLNPIILFSQLKQSTNSCGIFQTKTVVISKNNTPLEYDVSRSWERKTEEKNIAQLNKCNQQLCFDGLGLDIGQITALSGIWYCDRLGGNGSLGICVALFGQIIVNVLSYHFWLTEDIEFENGRKLELVEIVLCSEEIWDNLISASSRTAKLLHIVRKPVQS